MIALQTLPSPYHQAPFTERKKGSYFEALVVTYLGKEASYRDLYDRVWTYGYWVAEQGLHRLDTGIDLLVHTQDTGELHGIQCKFYAGDYQAGKGGIDSFFTASGERPFTHRLTIATTNFWSEHSEGTFRNQQLPGNRIDLPSGTGKRFAGLQVVEYLAGAGKRVSFLVPGLSSLSQTLTIQ